MNVWKKQTVRWRLNGKTVRKGMPNAQRETVESKRFYGTIRDENGKRKQVPLTEDVESSQTMLKRLQRDADAFRAAGVPKHVRERQRPVGVHVAAYVQQLEAKGTR